MFALRNYSSYRSQPPENYADALYTPYHAVEFSVQYLSFIENHTRAHCKGLSLPLFYASISYLGRDYRLVDRELDALVSGDGGAIVVKRL